MKRTAQRIMGEVCAALLLLGCTERNASTIDDESDSALDVGRDSGDTADTSSAPEEPDNDEWGEAPGMKVALAGVNLSGAEFGKNVPGTYDVDYTYPKAASLDYFIDKGMNAFRIPFLWERLQRTLFEEFNEREQERLISLTEAVTDKGAFAIIDPHNYARYNDQVVGSDIENDALADFWGRLALLFRDNPNVIFGLMNEPHDMETEQWQKAADAATAAIRDSGAANLLLVPGNGWTGAHSWTADYYGTPNSEVMSSFEDPLNHFAFEVHQYFDSDASGSHDACVSEEIGKERLTAFTEWARDNEVRAFLGEFGAPASDVCLHAVDNMLSFVSDNLDVFIGWTWWSAGPWWGDYAMSIEPDENGEDKPQMLVLSRHLNAVVP